jgi:hypothetical protein
MNIRIYYNFLFFSQNSPWPAICPAKIQAVGCAQFQVDVRRFVFGFQIPKILKYSDSQK